MVDLIESYVYKIFLQKVLSPKISAINPKFREISAVHLFRSTILQFRKGIRNFAETPKISEISVASPKISADAI